MPSISPIATRHCVIDRRPGRYLSFPDVARLSSGELLVAYREADEHVATTRSLLLSRSADQGRTWSAPVTLNPDSGHCPRFFRFAPRSRPDDWAIIDDCPYVIYATTDQGRSWTQTPMAGMVHGIPDRVLTRTDGLWLTTCHRHRGERVPGAGQPTTKQIVYTSADKGQTWLRRSVLAHEQNLVLCEASITRLAGGRLLALMRENSGVFEPMYASLSTDEGDSWTPPTPTPLIGHRPTAGLTRSGKLLVTYRNTAPAWGTAAWLGDPEELFGTGAEFAVHGPAQSRPAPTIQDGALRLTTTAEDRPALYALRPLTEPHRARATLRARVRVEQASQPNACAMRLGVWWRITADSLCPVFPPVDGSADDDTPDVSPAALTPGAYHDIRLEYDKGSLEAFVDGTRRFHFEIPADRVQNRPVVFGNIPAKKGTERDLGHAGTSQWRALSLTTVEPGPQRTYSWNWTPSDGLPDAASRRRVLELADDPDAAGCDFGYSGWVETADGRFFCTYHHGGGQHPDYEPGKTSFIRGSRFDQTDFTL